MPVKLESYESLFNRAAERKGGPKGVEQRLTKPASKARLSKLGEDRVLAEMTKKVFQSGFVWRVVRQKWPDFEEIFFQFDVKKILMMPPEMLERKATDPRIIRNLRKVKTIQNNALMIDDINRSEDGFMRWLADWPTDNIVGLWRELKRRGDRLGGNTGPYSLRAIGKDTFLITRDVEAYFRNHKLIDGGITSQRVQNQIQEYFNQWHQESGRTLQELSMICSFGVGENFV